MVRNQVNRLVCIMLACAALAGARNAHADDKKVMLKRTYKAMTVTTYKGTIKANIGGMDIEIQQKQKQTVKSVKENGNVVIVVEDLGSTLNGMEQPAGQPSTETRDKLGKLVDLVHDAGQNAPFTPEVEKVMSAVSDLILTDKEVAEGDSWETMLENAASKDHKIKIKTTYQGIDKVGGVELWKFKQVGEAVVNTDGSKMVNESTIWINPKDGLMEKMDAKLKEVPTTLPNVAPIDFTLAVERVKEKAVDPKTDK